MAWFSVTVLLLVAVATNLVFGLDFAKNDANNFGDIASDVLNAMNLSVDPCQDFYMYACGQWIAQHPLPPDKNQITKSLGGVYDDNQIALHDLLTGNTSIKLDPRLPAFFQACLDTNTTNSNRYDPIKGLLVIAENIYTVKDLFAFLPVFHQYRIYAFFEFGSAIDSSQPNMTIGGLSQGGLALPDPSLYLDTDQDTVTLRTKYLQHITNMFRLLGETPESAAIYAVQAFTIETKIANFTTDPANLNDPFQTFNPTTVKEFSAQNPAPWQLYFTGIMREAPKLDKITLDVPSFYSNLSTLLLKENITSLVAYIKWQIVHTFAPYLSDDFVAEDFSFFGVVLAGQAQIAPRWQRCIDATDAALGEVLGKYFVQYKFSGDSQTIVLSMLESIETQMLTVLKNISWMDDLTRAQAITKLGKVTNLIGQPANPQNFTKVSITDIYGYNVGEFAQAQVILDLQLIGNPTNKLLWEMTPSTVDAYYDPTKNQMVFPAGILQSPFFNASYPKAMNYGGSGVVLGHELTHGFDDEGRDYTGDGELKNWWQPATAAKFDSLANCIAVQYSGYEVLPGLFINGNLTLGENIADMGGVKNSYYALQTTIGADVMQQSSIVKGLTNAQLYFVAYTQGWCAVTTPETLRIIVATNPHSPPKFRGIGPLINHPEFANTFKCALGTPMNPKEKCQLW